MTRDAYTRRTTNSNVSSSSINLSSILVGIFLTGLLISISYNYVLSKIGYTIVPTEELFKTQSQEQVIIENSRVIMDLKNDIITKSQEINDLLAQLSIARLEKAGNLSGSAEKTTKITEITLRLKLSELEVQRLMIVEDELKSKIANMGLSATNLRQEMLNKAGTSLTELNNVDPILVPPQKTQNITKYLPIVRVPPQYPSRAAENGIEGYVIVTFTVTAEGTTKNIVAIESSHKMFVREAVKAARKYKYKPRVVDGEPIESSGVRVRIEFELA
ncbi:energy transducer TonB, partial [Emcibacteraceae bacterium]|nr:energy transducer TonB [Emcibacteraceae bacterium]